MSLQKIIRLIHGENIELAKQLLIGLGYSQEEAEKFIIGEAIEQELIWPENSDFEKFEHNNCRICTFRKECSAWNSINDSIIFLETIFEKEDWFIFEIKENVIDFSIQCRRLNRVGDRVDFKGQTSIF